MAQACHAARQPFQNHPSGHLGVWMMPWSAKEMQDGQHQRVDIPAHARTTHKGLLQKRLEEDLCLIVLVPHVPLMTQSVTGLNPKAPRGVDKGQVRLVWSHKTGSC